MGASAASAFLLPLAALHGGAPAARPACGARGSGAQGSGQGAAAAACFLALAATRRGCKRGGVTAMQVSAMNREIKNSFGHEDLPGEKFQNTLPSELLDQGKWHKAGGEDETPVNVFRVMKVASQAMRVKEVPPIPRGHAKSILEVLRSGGSKEEKAIFVSELKKEMARMENKSEHQLGLGQTEEKRTTDAFAMFRADARALRKFYAQGALSGGTEEGSLESTARRFLSRSWTRVWHASQEVDSKRTWARPRVARLLGGLLSLVPEEPLRNAFAEVLEGWAFAPRGPYDSVAKKRTKAVQAFARLEALTLTYYHRDRQSLGPKPTVVAEALLTVALADASVLTEHFRVFAKSVAILRPEDVVQTRLIEVLSRGPPCLRVWLLASLLEGGASLQSLGPGPHWALKACLELARESQPEVWEREEAAVRVGKILEAVKAAGGLKDLKPRNATLLFHFVGPHLGSAAPEVLTKLLEGPGGSAFITEETVLPLACKLPEAVGPKLWNNMAVAFLERWYMLKSGEILEVMKTLPTNLKAAPPQLLTELHSAYKSREGTLALQADQLTSLTQAWVGGPVPLVLRRLLVDAVEARLLSLDAKHLALACRILEEGGEEPLELGTEQTEPKGPMLWWRCWMARAVGDRRLVGWGRCSEAVREVNDWREFCPEVAGRVLQEIVVPEILRCAEDAPMELLFSLHAVVEGEQREFVEDETLEQVEEALMFEDSRISLTTAVMLANNETPVPFSPESELWPPLVVLIAERLDNVKAIDHFCRCTPSKELLEAVLRLVREDWIKLELQMRLKFVRKRGTVYL